MPSRTGDRTWTHGQRDSTLRSHRLETKVSTRDGIPTPDVLRECLKDGYCWWCEKGGWKMLAIHTYHAHGYSAEDLREMAGLYKHIPTCISGTSDGFSMRLKQQLADGRRTQPKNTGCYKIKYSTAGRIYQDTVRVATILGCQNEDQRKRAAERAREVCSKPHHCPVCGKMITKAHPITCSPECRKVIRQRTGAKLISALNSPKSIEKMKRTMRNKVAMGNFTPPIPAKPHPCPICNTIIPKSHPMACSPECLRKLRQRAQVKATLSRKLKIPKSEHSLITNRYLNGESATKMAREYNVSRKWINIITNKGCK